jgi:hypothetical protein
MMMPRYVVLIFKVKELEAPTLCAACSQLINTGFDRTELEKTG